MTDVEFVELRKIAEEARQASARPALWEPCRLYKALADGIEGLLDRVETTEATVIRQERYIEGLERVDQVGLTRRAEAAEQAIARVREIHRKDARLPDWPECTHCTVGMLQDPVDWPCPTIEAIDGPQ